MEKIQLMNVQRQHESYAEEYEAAVLSVLRSGQYIGGAQVSAFEEEFAAYCGARYGVSCGNGTDAIVLALRALGIGAGDEVITVGFTFFATAESIAAVGATPVFVDVCEDSYCMDPARIEERITPRTRAILPVHFYGQSADMDAITAIARRHGLKVVCDCAQAAGTRWRGERRGVLGDVACFSFFPTKNLGCAGDGGMVLTDEEAVAEACRAYKLHGSGAAGLRVLRQQAAEKGLALPEDMPLGESKYYNYLVGYNSRLDAIQAAILRRKLTHLEEFVDGRRRNAALYARALAGTGYTLPKESEHSYHSYYVYVLRHPRAGEIMEKLRAALVPCGTYYPVPLHRQGVFASLGYKEGALPVTERLCRETFAIPVYPELRDEEREYIIRTLIQADKELEQEGRDAR